MQKEKEIENSILDYLAHIPNSKFWKNQSGGIFDSKRQCFRKSFNKFHINGVSDILGIMGGRFICIEVKSPKGRLSPNQKVFLGEITSLGGLAFMARSIDDVKEMFRKEGLL